MTEAQYLPFVRAIARGVAGRAHVSDATRDDLVGAGALALVEVIRRYDPTRGASLKTFAAYRVRGAMLDYLRECDPVGHQRRARIKREGLPQPVIPVGLDEAENEAAVMPDLERTLWARELLARCLPKDRRVVVELFWGGLDQREVGIGMGVGYTRISQRRTRALARMRAAA